MSFFSSKNLTRLNLKNLFSLLANLRFQKNLTVKKFFQLFFVDKINVSRKLIKWKVKSISSTSVNFEFCWNFKLMKAWKLRKILEQIHHYALTIKLYSTSSTDSEVKMCKYKVYNCMILHIKAFWYEYTRQTNHSLVFDTLATTSSTRSTSCLPKCNHNGGCTESTHRKEPKSSSLSPYSSIFCGACWLELASWCRCPEEEIVDQCYPAASWIFFFYFFYYCWYSHHPHHHSHHHHHHHLYRPNRLPFLASHHCHFDKWDNFPRNMGFCKHAKAFVALQSRPKSVGALQ